MRIGFVDLGGNCCSETAAVKARQVIRTSPLGRGGSIYIYPVDLSIIIFSNNSMTTRHVMTGKNGC
jgi:hypothetical protein